MLGDATKFNIPVVNSTRARVVVVVVVTDSWIVNQRLLSFLFPFYDNRPSQYTAYMEKNCERLSQPRESVVVVL